MFSFGLIVGLNISIVTITTIAVIVFILTFEFLSGFLEFIVSESPLHREMVQTIYKELTMMGVVSFVVVMVNASKAAADHADWIVAIDFSHIMLFYLAIFFVFHAIYIMRLSFMAHHNHIRYQSETVRGLISDISEASKGYLSSFLYLFDYLPLSPLREKVEFKLLSVIFVDKNWLPEQFDVSMYLTGCYEKFALRTIERGLFSWFFLASLVILNFIRVRLDLFGNCGHTDIFASYDSYPNSYNKTKTKGVGGYSVDHRRLGAGGSADLSLVSHKCYLTHLTVFLFCGFIVSCYTAILLLWCRYYVKKLIGLSGAETVSDYVHILEFLYGREVEMLNPAAAVASNDSSRFTFAELKTQVMFEVDNHKHVDHRILTYKYVLATGMKLIGGLIELLYDILHWFSFNFFLLFKGAAGKVATTQLTDLFTVRPRGRTLSNEDAPYMNDRGKKKSEGHNNNNNNNNNDHNHNHSSDEGRSHHDSRESGLGASLRSKKHTLMNIPLSGGNGDSDGVNSSKFLGIKSFESERSEHFHFASETKKEEPAAISPKGVDKNDAAQKKINKLKEFTYLKVFKLLPNYKKSDEKSDAELIQSVLGHISNSSNEKKLILTKGLNSKIRSESLENSDLESRSPGAVKAKNGYQNNLIRNSRRTAITTTGPARLVSRVESYRLMQKEAKERLKSISAWSLQANLNSDNDENGTTANSLKKKKKKKNDGDDGSSEGDAEEDEEDDENMDVISIEEGVGSHAKNRGSIKKKVTKRTLDFFDYLDIVWDTAERFLLSVLNCFKLFISFLINCFRLLKSCFITSKDPTKVSPDSRLNEEDGEVEWMLPENLDSLFLFNQPKLLFLAFEVCIVLNCLYLANWAINFIYIVDKYTEWVDTWQLLMVCPLIFNVPFIGIMSRYCAYLQAFLELDCEVMLRTLDDMEDRQQMIFELRERITSSLALATMPKEQVLQTLFDIVDTDKSGFIDRVEFKRFLTELNIRYSEERFSKLYSAVDANCDYFISFDEISTLIFPEIPEEEQEQQMKLQKVLRRQSMDSQRTSILDLAAVKKAAEGRKSLNSALQNDAMSSKIDEENDDDDDDDDDDKKEIILPPMFQKLLSQSQLNKPPLNQSSSISNMKGGDDHVKNSTPGRPSLVGGRISIARPNAYPSSTTTINTNVTSNSDGLSSIVSINGTESIVSSNTLENVSDDEEL